MLPPSHPRIHDYPEVLDRCRATWSNSKEGWFKETREFPLPCEYEPSFVGINWPADLVTLYEPFVWTPILYLGISPPLEDKCHPHSLVTPIEPCYQIINNKASEGRLQHTFLWAIPRYRNLLGKSTKSRCNQAVLQGSSNLPWDAVFNPIFKKTSTHGVIGGAIKCLFFIQENAQSCLLLVKRLFHLNHELMKGHFHGFLSLVSMLIRM